jgi:replicative DNA helicase
VLGSILLSEAALDPLLIDVKLRAEDFYRQSHGLIFQAMIRLKEKTDPEPVDVLTVCEQLSREGRLEEAGGTAYVHSLPNLVPAAGNVRHYARIVKEHALMRRLLSTTRDIQDEVFSFQGPVAELLEQAESRLFHIAHEDRTGELRSIADVLHDELDKLELVSREGLSMTGTPSGFKDLDELTGGFQPGNMIVLAARPSMGKCLTGSTLIYDAATGARRPLREVVENGERGEEMTVASLGPDLKLRPARVSAFMRSGVQPVYRLTTKVGRSIELTANHPLLTLRGWRPLDQLRPGAYIAAPVGVDELTDARAPLPPASADLAIAAAIQTAPAVVHVDIAWDQIASIEPIGDQETFDLTVPATHNFVANDLIVHNSALMINIAENAAVKHDKGVALFSLEMSETELAQRFIASQAKIDGDDLRKGRVKKDRWPKVIGATEKLANSPLYVDDSSDLGILELRAKARRLHSRRELGLVVIDYLQLMRPEDSSSSRVEQIGQISRGLKMLARELSVPVIAVSQLSRAVESRPDKRPLLSDLRESGNIEQDADLVAFIYRDDYYNKESERPGEADLIIAKHRNGPIGEVALSFMPRYPKFSTLYREPAYGDPGFGSNGGGDGFSNGGAP